MRPAAAEVGLCILLAAADGEISDDELAALTTRIGTLLGENVQLGEVGAIVERELASISELGADAYLAALTGRISPERREPALRAACDVARADGWSTEELELLSAACAALGIDAQTLDTIAQPRPEAERQSAPAIAPTVSDPYAHEDAPDALTPQLEARLLAAGWRDPDGDLRAVGLVVTRTGALALEYESPRGTTLGLQHHACDRTLHLSVMDPSGSGPDLLIDARGNELAVVDALVALQDTLSLDALDAQLAPVVELIRLATNGRLLEKRRGKLVEPSFSSTSAASGRAELDERSSR